MRYVAAALLCAMGENEISAANMEKILSSVGVEADKERLSQVGQKHLSFHPKLFRLLKCFASQVVAACKGKSTEELIAAGLPKLASMGIKIYCSMDIAQSFLHGHFFENVTSKVAVVELLLPQQLPVLLLLQLPPRLRPRRRRRRRSPRRRTTTWASDSSTSLLQS